MVPRLLQLLVFLLSIAVLHGGITNNVAIINSSLLKYFSIGGDSDLSSVVTLPSKYTVFAFIPKVSLIHILDIMRKFNSNLSGFSIGTGNQNSANARFNVAKPGAVSA